MSKKSKDLSFVSDYRATTKSFYGNALGSLAALLTGTMGTVVLASTLHPVLAAGAVVAGTFGSMGGAYYIFSRGEGRQKRLMAKFYSARGITRDKDFGHCDFAEGSVLDEFSYTYPDGRRGLMTVLGTGEDSRPRIVFAEYSSAKIVEEKSLEARNEPKEITA